MMKASRFPGRALIFLSLLLRLPWQWLRRKPRPEQVQRVLILHQFLLGDALGLSPDPNAPDPFANQGNGAQELKDQFSKDMKTLCDVMRDTNKLMAKQLNGTKIIGNPK